MDSAGFVAAIVLPVSAVEKLRDKPLSPVSQISHLLLVAAPHVTGRLWSGRKNGSVFS